MLGYLKKEPIKSEQAKNIDKDVVSHSNFDDFYNSVMIFFEQIKFLADSGLTTTEFDTALCLISDQVKQAKKQISENWEKVNHV